MFTILAFIALEMRKSFTFFRKCDNIYSKGSVKMQIQLNDKEFNDFSAAEKGIIKWINRHSHNIWKYSITEIARENYVSTATVSRLIKKCGYKGISELKYSAASQNSMAHNRDKISTITENLAVECAETINSFVISDIQKIIREIETSKKIFIIARGNTALIARYFEFQLTLLGFNASLLSDSVILNSSYKLFKKTDLIIIFTVKNSTPELCMAAKNAKKNNAKVITCSCIENTKLKDYSDVYLGARQESQSVLKEYNMMSNLPLHLISRIIIDYLVQENYNAEY